MGDQLSTREGRVVSNSQFEVADCGIGPACDPCREFPKAWKWPWLVDRLQVCILDCPLVGSTCILLVVDNPHAGDLPLTSLNHGLSPYDRQANDHLRSSQCAMHFGLNRSP